jgi:hypothetical protein
MAHTGFGASLAPRQRGEGRGEGLLPQLREQHLQDALGILEHVVVPDSDHPIPKGYQVLITLVIGCTPVVLSSIDLDDQAPFAAGEVGVIAANRLLPDELEAPELAISNSRPKEKFGPRQFTAQRPCALGTPVVFAPHALPLTPALSP